MFQMFKGVVNPIPLWLERMGLVERKLVGQFEVEHAVDFDDLTMGALGDERERIVFFLFEYPSGRRSYETLHYGQAKRSRAYAKYLPEIVAWVHGGEQPVAPVAAPETVAAEPAPPVFRPFQVIATGGRS